MTDKTEREQEQENEQEKTLLFATIDGFTVGDVLKLIEAIQEGDNNDI